MNTAAEPIFDLSNFHGVGKPIEGASTMEDALKQAGLDFTVSQHDFITVGRDYQFNENGTPVINSAGRHKYTPTKTSLDYDQDGKPFLSLSQDSPYHNLTLSSFAPIVRDDTREVVAIMGNGYKVIQNHECVQALADILEESENRGEGLEIFRGGLIRGCSVLFLAARLPYDMEIKNFGGRNAYFHQYLVIHWSHTGEGKVVLSFVTYDPEYNTFLYTGSTSLNASVRHTKNAAVRLNDAKKYLKAMYRSFSNFQRSLEDLAGKPMDRVVFEEFLSREIFPYPDDFDPASPSGKRTITSIEGKRNSVAQRFDEIEGHSELDGFRAVCLHHDQDTKMKQKKKENPNLKTPGELRLFSSFKGTGSKAKKKAFDRLLTFTV